MLANPVRLVPLILICFAASSLPAQDRPGERAAKTGADIGAGFVFEGDVDHADPALMDDLLPPQVLSGTLEWDHTMDPSGQALSAESFTSSTYHQGLLAAEFTLDRNYVVNAEGALDPIEIAAKGNFIDLRDGEAREKADRIVIHAPMRGPALDRSGFEPRLLNLMLTDESGRMLETSTIFENAPPFVEGVFELTFRHPKTGEEALVKGELTLFANWRREVSPEEDHRMLEAQILELDAQLSEKETLIGNLQTELAQSQERLKDSKAQLAELQSRHAELAAENEALKNGETFAALQEANEALRKELGNSQDQRTFNAGTVAQMTVRQEFLASDNAELAKTNARLREELAASLADMSHLRNEVEALRQLSQKRAEQALLETPPNYPTVRRIGTPTEKPEPEAPSPLSIPPTPQNARRAIDEARARSAAAIPSVPQIPAAPANAITTPAPMNANAPAPAAPPPTAEPETGAPEEDEESSDRIHRRGPRR